MILGAWSRFVLGKPSLPRRQSGRGQQTLGKSGQVCTTENDPRSAVESMRACRATFKQTVEASGGVVSLCWKWGLFARSWPPCARQSWPSVAPGILVLRSLLSRKKNIYDAQSRLIRSGLSQYLNAGRWIYGVIFVDEISRVVPERMCAVFLKGIDRNRGNANFAAIGKSSREQEVRHGVP